MRLNKWISGLTFCLLAQLATGNELANDYNAALTRGQAHMLSHLIGDNVNYPGEFADVSSVNATIQDNAEFSVFDCSTNVPFSTVIGGAPGNAASTLVGLPAGSFIIELDGNADGVVGEGRSNDVTVNTVPLPAAAWLFGSALMGFVAFSARRTV
jgi:hypothetical protein